MNTALFKLGYMHSVLIINENIILIIELRASLSVFFRLYAVTFIVKNLDAANQRAQNKCFVALLCSVLTKYVLAC